MCGAPLPIVIQTFLLSGRKESAFNTDPAIWDAINNGSVISKDNNKIFGFCSNLPKVIVATGQLLMGVREGGSNRVVFCYGCLLHALSNFVRDICKEPSVRNTLTKTIKLAQFFKNTHIVNDLLTKVQEKLDKTTQTINY